MTISQGEIEQIAVARSQQLQGSNGLISLFIPILALSFAAIFIRLSERELSAVATMFNRFSVATLILKLLNLFKTLSDRQS